jgi:hypothetical protein
MVRGRSNRPTTARSPGGGRQVRVAADPSSFDREFFRWRTGELDLGGRWGWRGVHDCLLHRYIIPKMHDLEGMTWAQVKSSTGSHEGVEVDKLVREARDRLADMAVEDDTLFSLRLSGKERVWGIRRQTQLFVLWWDPEHEICPSLKDKSNRKNLKPTWPMNGLTTSGACPFGSPPRLGQNGPKGAICLRCDSATFDNP